MAQAILRIGLEVCDDLEKLAALVHRARATTTRTEHGSDRFPGRALALRVLLSRRFSDERRGLDRIDLVEIAACAALDELHACRAEELALDSVADAALDEAIERAKLFLKLYRKSCSPPPTTRGREPVPAGETVH
jgi:hypothetical protein